MFMRLSLHGEIHFFLEYTESITALQFSSATWPRIFQKALHDGVKTNQWKFHKTLSGYELDREGGVHPWHSPDPMLSFNRLKTLNC